MVEKIIKRAKLILKLLAKSEVNWQEVNVAIVNLMRGKKEDVEEASYQKLLMQAPECVDQLFEFIPTLELKSLDLKQATISLPQLITLVYEKLIEKCPKHVLLKLAAIELFQPQITFNHLPIETQSDVISMAAQSDPLKLVKFECVSKFWRNTLQTPTLWKACGFQSKGEFVQSYFKPRKFDSYCARKILTGYLGNLNTFLRIILLGETDSEKAALIKRIPLNAVEKNSGLRYAEIKSKHINIKVLNIEETEYSLINDLEGPEIFLIFPTKLADVNKWCKRIVAHKPKEKCLIYVMEPNGEQYEALEFDDVTDWITGIINWDDNELDSFIKLVFNAIKSAASIEEVQVNYAEKNNFQPSLNAEQYLKQIINNNDVNAEVTQPLDNKRLAI